LITIFDKESSRSELEATIKTPGELMYTEHGDVQKQAGELLNMLKEHPESWTRVGTILKFSQHQ